MLNVNLKLDEARILLLVFLSNAIMLLRTEELTCIQLLVGFVFGHVSIFDTILHIVLSVICQIVCSVIKRKRNRFEHGIAKKNQ